MTEQYRELYSSSNGDRWLLVRDSDRVYVRHIPNEASGGKATTIDIRTFLVRDGHGPQHHELIRLIGTLVEEDDVP